ncbi:LuxR C-terminal-related transcriptional regulator [Arthrobacter sp. B1805]|uniref:LuxR C-terminal-related transcriptional regulator n=1 Tax=Arthrobacter sp. B1805 TaxID=2058892 RepID=UPI0011B057B9|nr:LuxR C-terminal-related transcriptional regulator [Arthrobacter sp. B1805]
MGRTDELHVIASALQAPASAGVLLAGPSGIGKTALLHQALQEHRPDLHVVRIRGFASRTGTAYDALNSLLCDVDDRCLRNPATIVRALSELLGNRAAGGPVLLAVDNVELLDPPSAVIVAQLVAEGVGKALLTTRHFHLADPAFMALWRRGSLLRRDIGPLALGETKLLAEVELEAPVSGDVVRRVYQLSSGYPGFVRGCLRELRRQGLVIRSSNSWILRDGIAAPCREASAAVAEQIESLGPACRTASILVALSGGIPVPVLLRLTGRTAVDSLQGAGLLTVGRDRDNTVRCASPIIEAGVTTSLRSGEAETAYELATSSTGGWDTAQLAPHHHAAWRQKADLPLDAALVARAAGLLNDDGKYAEALELAAPADTGVPRDCAVQLEVVRSLLGQGDYGGAAQITARREQFRGAPPNQEVRLLLMEAELSQRSGTGARPDSLARAEAIASDLLDTDPRTAGTLHDEVLVARAEMLAFQGRYREAEDLLGGRKNGPAVLCDDTLVRIDTILCEAWSMGEQQSAAVELARSIAVFLLDHTVTARTREFAYAQIWESYCIAGDVHGALHIREFDLRRSDESCCAPSSYEEVGRALTRAAQGHDTEALRILVPTFDQLRHNDPWGVLPAAAAGIAYCYAKQHALQPMIDYVRQSESAAGTSWKVRQIARHFQVLSSSHTDARSAGGEVFTRLAVLDRERQEAHVLRLLALFRAARLGDRDAVEPLTALAARLQGPFARLAGLFAKGILNKDYELLIASMESARAMGDDDLAKEAARHALHAALVSDDKRALRHVQRRVREVMPEFEEWGTLESRLLGLTRREREIAVAAASGATNREIACSMCVSVRTVEGHLYQVYLKLDVGSRAELVNLIPAGRTQP